jgi:photoactive yellow protein
MKYNEGEAAIVGRTPDQVIGKNFFNDVAPCTKSHQFMGRFKTAVAEGSVNVMFEYAFDYKMKPTKVRVQLKSVSVDQGIWVFIKRA